MSDHNSSGWQYPHPPQSQPQRNSGHLTNTMPSTYQASGAQSALLVSSDLGGQALLGMLQHSGPDGEAGFDETMAWPDYDTDYDTSAMPEIPTQAASQGTTAAPLIDPQLTSVEANPQYEYGSPVANHHLVQSGAMSQRASTFDMSVDNMGKQTGLLPGPQSYASGRVIGAAYPLTQDLHPGFGVPDSQQRPESLSQSKGISYLQPSDSDRDFFDSSNYGPWTATRSPMMSARGNQGGQQELDNLAGWRPSTEEDQVAGAAFVSMQAGDKIASSELVSRASSDDRLQAIAGQDEDESRPQSEMAVNPMSSYQGLFPSTAESHAYLQQKQMVFDPAADDSAFVQTHFHDYCKRGFEALSKAHAPCLDKWSEARKEEYERTQVNATKIVQKIMSTAAGCERAEATVTAVIGLVIDAHTNGVLEMAFWCGPKPEKKLTCSEHADTVIDCLSQNKRVCVNLLEGKINNLAYAPKKVLSTKIGNSSCNSWKTERLATFKGPDDDAEEDETEPASRLKIKTVKKRVTASKQTGATDNNEGVEKPKRGRPKSAPKAKKSLNTGLASMSMRSEEPAGSVGAGKKRKVGDSEAVDDPTLTEPRKSQRLVATKKV